MLNVVIISGSPSATSTTAQLGDYVGSLLQANGVSVRHLRLRDLSPSALLGVNASDPGIADALDAVARADGLVLATPTFKAAYSGLMKAFLDVLPQFAFSGKVVLPLATGGSLAHVLALDYALRPVVQSMGARHVVESYFVLAKYLTNVDQRLVINPEAESTLSNIVRNFYIAVATGSDLSDARAPWAARTNIPSIAASPGAL